MKKDITLILLIISFVLALVAATFTANAQSQERSAGSPIGGIVVKGGQNGLEITSGNPIPSIGIVVKHNITDEQKTAGNPIGGIIVKSDKSISEKGIK